MYRSVIVPLDHPAACEYVLPVAVQIAHGAEAALRLVYLATPADGNGLPDQLLRAAKLTTRSSLPPRDYLDHLRTRLGAIPDLQVTADVLHERDGHAGAATLRVSDVDLVVLAAHDHREPACSRLGAITSALVRWRPAPVLVLRPNGAAPDPDIQSEFQRMLIPLDGSATAEQILAPAVALGRVMEATYTLLHVIELKRFVRDDALPAAARLDDAALAHAQAEAQDYLDSIALLMRAEGNQVRTRVIVAGEANTAIRQVVRQHAIDVIAMTSHRRSALDRLLVGSVAAQILRESRIPVLLHRPQERCEHT